MQTDSSLSNIVGKRNFFLLSGPCVVESEAICLEIAGHLKEICLELDIPLVFKASYRKANRSKSGSFTGLGDEKALEILAKVKQLTGLPVVSDIHAANEAAFAAQYVDILQIPAFLCRQTDLLEAAAETGKWVNIKKGQFLAPESMHFAAEKVSAKGNNKIMLTDRGAMYGYQDMIVDFRGIPTMKKTGFPVIMDCTHSLQQPNQSAGVTGGRPDMIATIAKAAIAVGADGLFMETHPRPAEALSDGANMLDLKHMKPLLQTLVKIREAILPC